MGLSVVVRVWNCTLTMFLSRAHSLFLPFPLSLAKFGQRVFVVKDDGEGMNLDGLRMMLQFGKQIVRNCTLIARSHIHTLTHIYTLSLTHTHNRTQSHTLSHTPLLFSLSLHSHGTLCLTLS